MSFSDPEMFKFPVDLHVRARLLEHGRRQRSMNLRDYLLKGGFLIVDDFRSRDWGNFDLQMSRVFPQGQWLDLDVDASDLSFVLRDQLARHHSAGLRLGGRPMFRGAVRGQRSEQADVSSSPTTNDMSEFWEFSDTGYAPVDDTNEAYKIGVNEFMYGITH